MFEMDITKELTDRRGRRFRLHTCLSTSGSRIVLFGPSGSGKSLTLQTIAGLIKPDSGRIRVRERVLFDSEARIDLPPRKRKVGLIYQDYALFPHLTVRQNVAFGLKRLWRGMSEAEQERVEDLLEVFGLRRVAEAKPEAISGGQKQRAALARGLASNPDLLLLDEPFSALDKPLRIRMQREVSETLARFSLPLVLVTHDPEEMELFADTVAVFDQGRITALEEVCNGRLDTTRVHRAMEQAYLGQG